MISTSLAPLNMMHSFCCFGASPHTAMAILSSATHTRALSCSEWQLPSAIMRRACRNLIRALQHGCGYHLRQRWAALGCLPDQPEAGPQASSPRLLSPSDDAMPAITNPVRDLPSRRLQGNACSRGAKPKRIRTQRCDLKGDCRPDTVRKVGSTQQPRLCRDTRRTDGATRAPTRILTGVRFMRVGRVTGVLFETSHEGCLILISEML